MEWFKKIQTHNKLNELSKEEWGKYNITVWNCSSWDGYFASFDIEIPRRLIKYFTFTGDSILDPFVGGGTTLIAAKELNRNAYGVDCSEKAIELCNKRLSALEIKNNAKVKVIHGDSRRLEFEKETFDFIITSPPYFDIVKYSDDSSQLGNITNYNKFLDEVMKVFKECYRVLKKSKYFCVITSDVRKAHWYYPIHVDYINRLQKIGFKLHQIMINIFHSSGKREDCMGYPSNFHPKMIHEYILIFQKL